MTRLYLQVTGRTVNVRIVCAKGRGDLVAQLDLLRQAPRYGGVSTISGCHHITGV